MKAAYTNFRTGRFILKKAAVVFILLCHATLLSAQTFTVEGLDFYINPWVNIERVGQSNLSGSSNYRVTLQAINMRMPTRILYNGVYYEKNQFNSQLLPFFENLRITSVSATAYTSGLKDCKSISSAAWREGQSETRFCEPEKQEPNPVVTIDRFVVSSISTSGISALKNKLRELIAEEEKNNKRKEQIKNLINKAEVLYGAKKFEEAIALYDEILTMDPENSQALNRRKFAQFNLDLQIKNQEQREKAAADAKSNANQNKTQQQNNNTTTQLAVTKTKIAMTAEAEGDRLARMGNLNGAIQKYQEAQAQSYSEARSKKIENVAYYMTAVALNEGMEKLNEGIDKLIGEVDPKGQLNWSHMMVRYETGYFQKDRFQTYSQAAFLGAQWNPLFFSVEMRLGWMETMSVQHNVRFDGRLRSSSMRIEEVLEETVFVNQSSGFLGFSGGVNLPLSSKKPPYLSLNANYGFDWLLFGAEKVQADQFVQLKREPRDILMRRFTAGLLFQFPKTNKAIGLYYNLLTQKVKDQLVTANTLEYTGNIPFYPPNSNSYSQYEYSVGPPVPRNNFSDVVQHSTIGISFIWGMKTSRR